MYRSVSPLRDIVMSLSPLNDWSHGRNINYECYLPYCVSKPSNKTAREACPQARPFTLVSICPPWLPNTITVIAGLVCLLHHQQSLALSFEADVSLPGARHWRARFANVRLRAVCSGIMRIAAKRAYALRSRCSSVLEWTYRSVARGGLLQMQS